MKQTCCVCQRRAGVSLQKGVTKATRICNNAAKFCSFIEGSRKRDSPDSGRESVDQLLQALRAAEKQ